MTAEIEVLPGRLWYAAIAAPPPPTRRLARHYFTTDRELVYWYMLYFPLLPNYSNWVMRLVGASIRISDRLVWATYTSSVPCSLKN